MSETSTQVPAVSAAFLLTLLFLVITLPAYSQQGPTEEAVFPNQIFLTKPFLEIGGIGGYSISEYNLPEGRYKPIKLMSHIAIRLNSKKVRPKSYFMVYAEPQFNPVVMDGSLCEQEFGLNIGLRFHYTLHPRYQVYILAGTGPHFITAQVARQATGFIFSDNVAAGLYYQLAGPYALNIQGRFRHISNAGLKEPNYGLNNYFILTGLSRFF
jgi:hypothetical protein